jgi:basic membrane protein A
MALFMVFSSSTTPSLSTQDTPPVGEHLSSKNLQPLKPAILYDPGGGKFDQSFGQAVHAGAEHFKKDFGIESRDFKPQNDTQIEQSLQRFARETYSPIITAGFIYETMIDKTAPSFPNTKFVIVDAVVKHPNVQSIIFKEYEGSFLVGLLAAKASKTGTIGFIGGMDTPFIRKFSCGYLQGARYVNKDIRVLENMAGATPSAWNDPVKGGELARSQMEQGADVIYHAAGPTGTGVLQAVADAKKLGIGVDSNQNGMFPGYVLTSMIKRVDTATYNALVSAHNGTWQGGIIELGIKENGVGWALDEHNAKLITPSMKESVDQVESLIRSGALKVHDYTTDNTCPMNG